MPLVRLRIEGPRSGQYVGFAKSLTRRLTLYIDNHGTFEKFIPLGANEPNGYVHLRYLGEEWDVFVFTTDKVLEGKSFGEPYSLRQDVFIAGVQCDRDTYIHTRLPGTWDAIYTARVNQYYVLDEQRKSPIPWPPVNGFIPDYESLVAQQRLFWTGVKLIPNYLGFSDPEETVFIQDNLRVLSEAPKPPTGYSTYSLEAVLSIAHVAKISGVWHVLYNFVVKGDDVMAIGVPTVLEVDETTIVTDPETGVEEELVSGYRLVSADEETLARCRPGRVVRGTTCTMQKAFSTSNGKTLVFENNAKTLETLLGPRSTTLSTLTAFYVGVSAEEGEDPVPLAPNTLTAYSGAVSSGYQEITGYGVRYDRTYTSAGIPDSDAENFVVTPVDPVVRSGLGKHTVGEPESTTALDKIVLETHLKYYPDLVFPVAVGSDPYITYEGYRNSYYFEESDPEAGTPYYISTHDSWGKTSISPGVAGSQAVLAPRGVVQVGSSFFLENPVTPRPITISSVTGSGSRYNSGQDFYGVRNIPSFTSSVETTLVSPDGTRYTGGVSQEISYRAYSVTELIFPYTSADIIYLQSNPDIYQLIDGVYPKEDVTDLALYDSAISVFGTKASTEVTTEDGAFTGVQRLLYGGLHDLPVEVVAPEFAAGTQSIRYSESVTPRVEVIVAPLPGSLSFKGLSITHPVVRINGIVHENVEENLLGLCKTSIPYNTVGLDGKKNLSAPLEFNLALRGGPTGTVEATTAYSRTTTQDYSTWTSNVTSTSIRQSITQFTGPALKYRHFGRFRGEAYPPPMHDWLVDFSLGSTLEVINGNTSLLTTHSRTNYYVSDSEYQVPTSYDMAVCMFNIIRNMTTGESLLYKASLPLLQAKLQYINVWWYSAIKYLLLNAGALKTLHPELEGAIVALVAEVTPIQADYEYTLANCGTKFPALSGIGSTGSNGLGVFTKYSDSDLTVLRVYTGQQYILQQSTFESIFEDTDFNERTLIAEENARLEMLVRIRETTIIGSVDTIGLDAPTLAGLFRFGCNMAFI